MLRPTVRKIKKDNYEINITGNRDPRGPDIDIFVQINDKGHIVLTIPHTQRCYQVKKWQSFNGFTKITAI